ncbi:hypothetical protein P0W64_05250 [Tsukamurella sp. 8F]|uniref:DUF7373 family lipoprotein n=1 Tax=unclassified Tsukamurella TaxID=2633480 RepID=UPI0023BA3D03|nr:MULTISPECIES: hypothetical protein [unclassified Tsukamurella]MDF0528356.1 hypothetical protein [Tsukamurella sp. 8J]MDF0586181.1 hypothetical protein [Tsukamurella sp. 8F]
MRSGAVCALFVAAATAACATTVPGTPVADPSVTRLDVGNYPTTTARVPVAKRPADAYQQEGWKIADSVITVRDIDPRLVKNVGVRVPIVSTALFPVNPVPNFTDDQATALAGYHLLTGFIDSRSVDGKNTGAWAGAGILRFQDADSATRALAAVTPPNALVIKNDSVPGGKITAVRGGTLKSSGKSVLSLVIPVGSLWVVAAMIDQDFKTAADVSIKALKAQFDRVRSYSPTQVADTADYPMDSGSIMTLLLPAKPEAVLLEMGLSADGGMARGYRTGRAEAHMWDTDSVVHELSLDPGVELVASNGASDFDAVYRMKTAGDAERLFGRFFVPGAAASVKGVPNDSARCLQSVGKGTMCGVRVGRYMRLTVAKAQAEAYQRAAAGYLIQQHAPE